MSTENERILIFTKNWLGDVIFEEPFIRAVKRKFDNAYIVCVTNYRCQDILLRNPAVDEVIGFDDRKRDKGLAAKYTLSRLLKAKKITKAFILHRSFSRAAIVFCAGIRERYGYSTKGRSLLLTHSLPEPPVGLHRIDYFLNILEKNNFYVDAPDARTYTFYCNKEDEAHAAALLASCRVKTRSFVAINPGANWEKKRWPCAHFIDLVNKIAARYHVPVLITGSEQDEIVAQQIIEQVSAKKVYSVCGKTTMPQLGALFSFSELVISADSGPLHVAGGVGTSVIALFGPTDAQATGPRGRGPSFIIKKVPQRCSVPCFDTTCNTAECMEEIRADDVLNIIHENNLIEPYDVTE